MTKFDTTLGSILVAMGALSEEELEEAVQEQEKSSIEQLIGKILVANSAITTQQLDIALSAQDGLRSKKKHIKAGAQAVIATHSSDKVIAVAGRIRKKSATMRKTLTGESLLAVGGDLLVKNSD